MNNQWPKYKEHKLDDGKRYLSTRVGEGSGLVILTTPISVRSVRLHAEILKEKVNALLNDSTGTNE